MKLVKQKRLLPGLGGGRVVAVRVIVLFVTRRTNNFGIQGMTHYIPA